MVYLMSRPVQQRPIMSECKFLQGSLIMGFSHFGTLKSGFLCSCNLLKLVQNIATNVIQVIEFNKYSGLLLGTTR